MVPEPAKNSIPVNYSCIIIWQIYSGILLFCYREGETFFLEIRVTYKSLKMFPMCIAWRCWSLGVESRLFIKSHLHCLFLSHTHNMLASYKDIAQNSLHCKIPESSYLKIGFIIYVCVFFLNWAGSKRNLVGEQSSWNLPAWTQQRILKLLLHYILGVVFSHI